MGTLSRFGSLAKSEAEKQYDILALISGPEPQRTAFEQLIIQQLAQMEGKFAIVAGKPEEKSREQTPSHIDYFNHLPTEVLAEKIQASKLIISRPGYSTIMDLAALGSKAIFVPTPGQTEQEYLGQYYLEKQQHFSMPQKKMDIKKALVKTESCEGFLQQKQEDLLPKAVSELLNSF